MDYKEALDYIYSFTDYERGGKFTRRREENLLLETMLLERLGNPHQSYTSTLIAGTKGKGSTAAFIERVLREAQVHTGLYTQPDLHTFRERAQVDGHLIKEEEVAALVPEIRAAVESIRSEGDFGTFITYHIGTALALLYFARQHVKHAVLEVGLGGRLDATNVTQPLVSVITSISYDHMSILGNTLTQIATEKAGIIKSNGLVVTSAQAPEALLVIAQVAQQRQARLVRVGPVEQDPAQAEVDAGLLPAVSYRYQPIAQQQQGQSFSIIAPGHVYEQLETPLVGIHQLENATAALATLELLRERGIVWDEQALRRGLAGVHWPARIEVVQHNPTVIVDGAHNADSLQKLQRTLTELFPRKHLIVVLGMNTDKDLSGNIKALASADSVILTRTQNPRATAIDVMQALFVEHAPQVHIYTAEDSQQALDMALKIAEPEDLICATGSLYLAGEALRWAAKHGSEIAAAEIEGVDHSFNI